LIKQYLNNVEKFVRSEGGAVLLSCIGQICNVPKPLGFPRKKDGFSLKAECDNDPRFVTEVDNAFTPPRCSVKLAAGGAEAPALDPLLVVVQQYVNNVEIYVNGEMTTLADIAEHVPLPPLLSDAGHTLRNLLEEEAQQRFVFRTLRSDAANVYVDMVQDAFIPPASTAVVMDGEVVVDRGSPEDIVKPRPDVTPSWETPVELRSLEVCGGRKQGTHTLWAPLELKNKDYARRILDLVSEGINAEVRGIVVAHFGVDVVGKPQFDLHKILVDIKKNQRLFADAFAVNSSQFKKFLNAAVVSSSPKEKSLLEVRNMLMHMNFFGSNNSATAQVLLGLFQTAFQVLGEFAHYRTSKGGRNPASDAIQTLIHLRMQFEWHRQWNAKRFELSLLAENATKEDSDDDLDSEGSGSDDESTWRTWGGSPPSLH
jgi:hypothetical protein